MAEKHGLAPWQAKTSRAEFATLLLKEGFEAYFAHAGRSDLAGGVAPKTLAKYRTASKKFMLAMKKRGVATWQQVGEEELLAFIEEHKRTAAPRTIQHDVTTIK